MSADLDREIDRAVHEMLDVEPRADVRARVLERIEPVAAHRGWAWIAVPVAVAAVILLAIVLRPAPAPTLTPPIARVEPPVTAPPSTRPAVVPPTAERPSRIVRTTPPDLGVPQVAGAPSIDVAPLNPPALIAVPPVESRPIEHQEVRIATLAAITPIVIEPLPDGGRH